jgi:NADH:ubiquinone oxidoreductase subunit F (NADH-binding)/(2Fe-2S) ferredoxin
MTKLAVGDLARMQAEQADTARTDWIKVGTGTCGVAAGAEQVFRVLADEVKKRGLAVDVRRVGCVGMCAMEPLVEVGVQGAPRTMYGAVDEPVALRIIEEHVIGKRPLASNRAPGVAELGFREQGIETPPSCKQLRIVTRNCGMIDPSKVDDYIARGGYQALESAIHKLGPEGVLREMKTSGLRGRGGAGFPTWLKWTFTRNANADQKYMICNGDEGDPGAYMDRSVLESDPHSVIEGMLIAAFTIGASIGYFYIRAEYPLAVDRIENAIRQARRLGLVGDNILGSSFSCDLEVRLGAGAFVCGEETALMASIEGKRGTPTPRPPFPSQQGLWKKPSNINNVETLASIAPIIQRGGAWYAGIGVGKSTGTKVFAVTGKVLNSGLVEVPLGTTIREIVVDTCGGVAQGRELKAIQTGGPSGGVIPADKFDTRITYESLAELGSIMGSGGMIVMDDRDDMVDIATFYMGFCVEESCGKCAPCRIGGKQMLLLLEKVKARKATQEDINLMTRLATTMQKASLCGLGQTAPNPVLSTYRYFRSEYERLLS